MSYKLFIPGPVAVSSKIYEAMATPLVGHRSPEFAALFKSLQPGLRQLFGSSDPVYISTSSAWGVMEGSVRNVTAKKVLNCMCGAFSDKWNDVSARSGLDAGALRSEWGQPLDPEALRTELATGQYDAVTIVHNETSTGLMNSLAGLMAVIREFPEVISIIDTVSSFAAVPIEKDALGIDIMLTGTQKALALPPGMSLVSVSPRALERAASIPGRGLYFDLLEFHKNYENGFTPTTPNIPLIYGLKARLDEIEAEGLDARFARHRQTNALVHAWVERQGFELFPADGYASVSLTCVRNNREIDVPELNRQLRERFNCVIDGGYGKIKGKTFRISNMGDETEETITGLLSHLDAILDDMKTN